MFISVQTQDCQQAFRVDVLDCICRAVRLIEKQQEQYFQEFESLEHEVDIANQRSKLDMLKRKLDELVKDANDATLVRSL